MKFTTATFGSRLAKARKSRELSQTELAERVDLRQAAISGYEKNFHFPPLDKLCQIANELGVSIDWLCGAECSSNRQWDKVRKYCKYLEDGNQFVSSGKSSEKETGKTKKAEETTE